MWTGRRHKIHMSEKKELVGGRPDAGVWSIGYFTMDAGLAKSRSPHSWSGRLESNIVVVVVCTPQGGERDLQRRAEDEARRREENRGRRGGSRLESPRTPWRRRLTEDFLVSPRSISSRQRRMIRAFARGRDQRSETIKVVCCTRQDAN